MRWAWRILPCECARNPWDGSGNVLIGSVLCWVRHCNGYSRAQHGVGIVAASRPRLPFLLVASKLEGVLCAILAFPLLALGLGVGVVLGYLFRRYFIERLRHQIMSTVTIFVLTPLIVLAGHRLERPSLDTVRRETVASSIFLSAQPEEVWTSIQSIDSINAAKPLLMYFGLPIPLRCTLEKKAVGAKRTCYFENGFIEEIITEWDPPHSMQLTIDRTNMPGRHWLGFEKAAYDLHQEGSGTRLTRTTTITSHLYPVWYWRYFERLGVSSEHDYLLRDLSNRLNR